MKDVRWWFCCVSFCEFTYTKLITIITEWLRIVCREIIIIINVALESYQHVAWWLLSMYFSTEKEVLGFLCLFCVTKSNSDLSGGRYSFFSFFSHEGKQDEDV